MSLVLLLGCTAGRPGAGLPGNDIDTSPAAAPQPALQEQEEEQAAADSSERVFGSLPVLFEAVQVEQRDFALAVTGLLLEMPLQIAPGNSVLAPGHRLALAQAAGDPWRNEIARDYGSWCERRDRAGDCLALFNNGPELEIADKRSIALALAITPALEAAAAEARGMLNPVRVMAAMTITVAVYMTLMVAPDPLSKGVVTAFTLLMWGYLGWELWGLMKGWIQLSADVERAHTFAELREAGERFSKVLGPNSVRILVLVGTAAVGETAALVARAPKLPGFTQVASRAEANGVQVLEAASNAERVITSVPEASIHVVVPPNAMAMGASTARGTSLVGRAGRILANGYRAFRSFSSFKRAMGKAGEGFNWHHVVEQTPGNLKRFGPEALHNTENVIKLEVNLHNKLSGFYSSIRESVTGSKYLTVRQWLSTQSYEAQRQFGLQAIENIRRGIW